MTKIYTFTFLMLLLLCTLLPPVNAQSPFIAKDAKQRVSTSPILPYPLLSKITDLQERLNKKVAILTRQAKKTRSLRPLISLILVVMLYGILHAAGPGHGKAVTISYLISGGRKLGSGILLGNLTALFHGLSGVILVFIVHFVLRSTIVGPLQGVSRITQIISYSLITFIGVVMLARSLFSWRRKPINHDLYPFEHNMERKRSLLAMALCMGIIPCPGVTLIMLFCLSINAFWIGLVLAFFMIVGMSMTISAVGVFGLAGKNLSLGALVRRPMMAERIEKVIENGAALMVTLLGFILVTAAF
jgi:nickel/cobalt exporter